MSRIQYVDVDVALSRLLQACKVKPKAESVKVEDSYGRVLFEDLHSPMDNPLTDKSHMDGYALRSIDVSSASAKVPVRLKIRGALRLVDTSAAELKSGECVKVPTGGLVPRGADAVVPKEDVHVFDGFIEVTSTVRSGSEVVPRGSDLRKGEVLLHRGSVVRAQDVSLFRFLGLGEVEVFKRPIVGVMSVGSELTDKFEETGRGKVIRSHDFMVHRLISEVGASPRDYGIVPDDLGSIVERLRSALKMSSLLLTIGGSSVGEADLVSKAIDELDDPGMMVHGLRLQPGRVAGFGCVQGKPVILLPGLIQSTVNSFIFLAYPLIRSLCGLDPYRGSSSVQSTLTKTVEFRSFKDFRHVTWVRLERKGDALMATPVLGESPMMNVLLRSDGYVLSGEGVEVMKESERVEVNLIKGLYNI